MCTFSIFFFHHPYNLRIQIEFLHRNKSNLYQFGTIKENWKKFEIQNKTRDNEKTHTHKRILLCIYIAMAMRMWEQQVDNIALVQSNRNRTLLRMDRVSRQRLNAARMPASQSLLPPNSAAVDRRFVLILWARLVHHPLTIIVNRCRWLVKQQMLAAHHWILWITEISMGIVRIRATPCLRPKVTIHRRHRTDMLATIMPITIPIRT